jgi:hypothetical protein
LAAAVMPSRRVLLARGDFAFGGAAVSAGATIFSVDFSRADVFFLAGADSCLVFIAASPCVKPQKFVADREIYVENLPDAIQNFADTE